MGKILLHFIIIYDINILFKNSTYCLHLNTSEFVCIDERNAIYMTIESVLSYYFSLDHPDASSQFRLENVTRQYSTDKC